MVKSKSEIVAEYFKKRLVYNGINPKKIIVFGSSINADIKAGSDIDIAIISDDFKDVDIFERSLLTSNAERETMRKYDYPLDVIRLTVDEFENDLRIISKYIKVGKLAV